MQIPYFPGCTLSDKAKDLDIKGRAIAEALGYTLTDIPDWTCCGTVFPNSLKNVMKFAGPYRMLANTAAISDKLVTLCSACFNVMKRTNLVIRENPEIREKLKKFTDLDYNGEVEVMHYLTFLKDVVTYDKIKEVVKQNKKESRKVTPYYGCLLLRPHEELGLDDPENPTSIAEIINLVEDTVVEFPSQNECCGAYLTVYEKEEDLKPARNLCQEAKEYGAELMVTSCPLCYYNLDKTKDVPVLYFTDYLASALGIE